MQEYNKNPAVRKEMGKKKTKSIAETPMEEKVLLDKARTQFINDLKKDVMPIIENLLALKHQKAKLHGLKSYSELKLTRSMAHTPSNVDKFYDQLE